MKWHNGHQGVSLTKIYETWIPVVTPDIKNKDDHAKWVGMCEWLDEYQGIGGYCLPIHDDLRYNLVYFSADEDAMLYQMMWG